MVETKLQGVLGNEHDCQYASDPRKNKDLAALLSNQNVLIAGAGRGIGRATAEFFAHTEAKSLSIMALELAEIEETAEICKKINPQLLMKTAAFDVRDYGKVQQFVAEVNQHLGRIDVVFMNAGRPPQWLGAHESDPQVWWDTVTISLQGAFNFSRATLPLMRGQGGGRIIFTASAGAHMPRGMSSYTVGKLGVVRLGEVLHHENKDYGIKTFTFHPGSVQTRFFTDFRDEVDGTTKSGSYLSQVEGDKKSAELVVSLFKDAQWDTPQMAAGLVTVLASGRLDFMSGRYVDATVKVDDYVADKDKITAKDLHRVKLVADANTFLPDNSEDA
jgi:NAD(P)-dependent dehydrogenase (short-subunit alcohol dehydrogenase family)